MSNNRVLDFASYHKLNEADEISGTSSAVDQIVDLFFQAYGAIVTKIGAYPDAVKDLTGVAEADDKGKAMLEAIDKVAGKADPKYKEAGAAIQVAARKLKEAFETLMKTEEGKKDAEGINDKIYKKIIAQITSLKDAAGQAPKIKKVGESEEFNGEEQGHLHLLEKNTFTDERSELIKKITPIYSQVVYLGKNSPVQALKSECLTIAKELKGYYDVLSSEPEWESMKRKERKEKLEEILGKVNDVPSRMNDIQSKALVKLGIDGKVQSAIKNAMDLINSALETLNKTEEVQIVDKAGEEKEGEKKEEKKEEKKDEKSYDEIKSGNVEKSNLSKSGKNLESIKKYQEKLNQFLGDKEKIKADGLYGKGTEEAVNKVASKFSALLPELKGMDGKSMTPAFLKFVDKYEENKDKIAGLFK
jgi:hypothetical protein